jgi:tetratricopeptide (TPR) repeat protein
MRIRYVVVAVLMLLGGWSCSRDPNVVKQKYLESGNRYHESGKYREAVIMYRNALRKDMKFGEAYYRLGLTQLRMGQQHWLNAIRALRRAVDTLDYKPALRTETQVRLADTLLGFYLADSRRPANLRKELDGLVEKLLGQDPNSADGLRMEGYLLLHADKKPQEAIGKLRLAHGVKPFHPPVVLALCQALFSEGQATEAETLAQELIQKQEGFGPIYDLLFAHYMRSNRLDDAENILKAKAANNPKQAGPMLQLAAYYGGVRRQEDMQATLRKLTSNTKDFPNAFRLVGDFYLRLREFESAIRSYGEGIKANPKDAAELRLLIAQALLAQNKQADAMRELDQVLKEQPNHDTAKAMRASLMIDPAHPEQVRAAVTELQSLVSRMPRNAVLRFNLARALAARGELAQTRTQLQEAVKLDPSYLPPRLSLARLSMAQREFTQVLQATKEVLELDPRNLEARLLQAQALVGMGNPAQARKEVEESIKLHPTSLDAALHLGMISVQERKFKEAEDIFVKVHRANPGDPRTVLGLSEVYALQEQYDKGIQLLSAELAKQPERTDLSVSDHQKTDFFERRPGRSSRRTCGAA